MEKDDPAHINCPSGLPVYYTGAPLELGKLPAFFYFSLSGEDSLHLDPFCQPATFLKEAPLRIYSCTIPGHGPGLKNTEAMHWWAEKISKNENPFTLFFEQCLENIDYLVQHDLVDENAIAIGGLSRGGFIATHLAARDPRIQTVVGFAPLTTTQTILEFSNLQNSSITQSLELTPLFDKLIHKRIRYYIGNRDERVSTDACYDFIRQLTNYAYEHKVRSPAIELLISPSIGHKGHGTNPSVFKDGADWIRSALLMTN